MTELIRNYLVYLKEIGMETLPVPSLPPVMDNTVIPPPSGADQKDSMEDIERSLGVCTRCGLSHERKKIVFGTGNHKARLAFVGEAPGRDEDIRGEPFVGRAGQLLTRIIEAMGLSRSDVYICNVVKCRPPGNRNPKDDEIDACRPFLERQIDAITPEIIVALGTHAAQTLLNTDSRISELRGRFHFYRDGITVMPTYHPAYLLRNPAQKKATWNDMQLIMDRLGIDNSE